MPLEVGNEWEYSYFRRDCPNQQVGGPCRVVDTTYVYRVVEEVVQDQDTLFVIEGPGTRLLYGYRQDERVVWDLVESDPDAGLPFVETLRISTIRNLINSGSTVGVVNIGGVEYDLEMLRGGDWEIVRGVGIRRFHFVSIGSGQASTRVDWNLTGATVRGESYGSFATAADPDGVDVVSGLTVGPNPSTGRLMVRAQLAAPAMVHVKIIDALGRTVWGSVPRAEGRELVTPADISSLSPGAYIVRLFIDGRPASSALVTRLGNQ